MIPLCGRGREEVIQAGKSGEKEVVEEIVRENGEEVSRTKISEKILLISCDQKDCARQQAIPEMGSGELAWPVQGTITLKVWPAVGYLPQGS